MNKFIHNDEREGSCYLEFQFCETNEPIKNGEVRWEHIMHWRDVSLYMDWDDFGEFYELCSSVLDCAVLANGERGCDSCGINYYGKTEMARMLAELEHCTDKRYCMLIPWLKEAEERGKGFYILGV